MMAAQMFSRALLQEALLELGRRAHAEGKTIEITFDPRYLADALKTLDDTAAVTAELIDSKNAAVFKTDDQYTYVVMPLTRDR